MQHKLHIFILGGEDTLEKGKDSFYSCRGNPTDRGAWWATVYGVTKSWTHLSTHTQSEVLRIITLINHG